MSKEFYFVDRLQNLLLKSLKELLLLWVIGGFDGRRMLDCVEIYDAKTQKWVTTDLKLNKPKVDFDFLAVKLEDIISNLKAIGK